MTLKPHSDTFCVRTPEPECLSQEGLSTARAFVRVLDPWRALANAPTGPARLSSTRYFDDVSPKVRSRGLYSLKHIAEDWGKVSGHESYVSEDALAYALSESPEGRVFPVHDGCVGVPMKVLHWISRWISAAHHFGGRLIDGHLVEDAKREARQRHDAALKAGASQSDLADLIEELARLYFESSVRSSGFDKRHPDLETYLCGFKLPWADGDVAANGWGEFRRRHPWKAVVGLRRGYSAWLRPGWPSAPIPRQHRFPTLP